MTKQTFCFFATALLLMACTNRKDLTDHVSVIIPNGWVLQSIDSNNCIISNDTFSLKVSYNFCLPRDMNSGFPSPLEYIYSSNPNDISSQKFLHDDVVYTDSANLDFVKKNNPNKLVKSAPSPIIEHVLEITDTALKNTGVDYLIKFRNDSLSTWLPYKLPEVFKNYIFKVENGNGIYKKYYYPIENSFGKFCMLVYDSSKSYKVLIKSSVVKNDNGRKVREAKKILNSLKW